MMDALDDTPKDAIRSLVLGYNETDQPVTVRMSRSYLNELRKEYQSVLVPTDSPTFCGLPLEIDDNLGSLTIAAVIYESGKAAVVYSNGDVLNLPRYF
jgi:hypothetical protein